MKRLAVRTSLLLGLLGMVGVACSGTDAEEDPYLDEVFTRTMVHFNDDGTETVHVDYVTRRQQFAEHAQEEAEKHGTLVDGVGEARQALSQDTGCASTSLRLWSEENYTGAQLCFSGTGEAALSNYCLYWFMGNCIGFWDADVESLKAGDRNGVIGVPDYPSCGVCTAYDVSENIPNCDSDCRNGTHVKRNATCIAC